MLVLLLVFAHQLSQDIWIKAGTAKKPRYIKVHDITIPKEMLNGLLAFHAITGCDTTRQFTGIGKKRAWKVFQQHPNLLHDFGEDEVTSPAILSLAEQFVCKLYDSKSTSNSIHVVRCTMFHKQKANVDTLPPRDALTLHIKRAHYKTNVWKQSLVTHPELPSPLNSGWHMVDGMLFPRLLPKEHKQARYVELTICGCKETGNKCSTRHYSCHRGGMYCSGAYGCARAAWCLNTIDSEEIDSDEI